MWVPARPSGLVSDWHDVVNGDTFQGARPSILDGLWKSKSLGGAPYFACILCTRIAEGSAFDSFGRIVRKDEYLRPVTRESLGISGIWFFAINENRYLFHVPDRLPESEKDRDIG